MKWINKLFKKNSPNVEDMTIKLDIDTTEATQHLKELHNEAKQLRLPILSVSVGQAPILRINGKSYPITQLSYQYVTDNDCAMRDNNTVSASYINDRGGLDECLIDVATGEVIIVNEWS